MKSTEVYKLLREEVGPWSKEQGFRPAKTMLSWHRPYKDKHIVFWFQVSRDGWDAFAGSKLTVEFQLSTEPVVGSKSIRRQRFGEFLSDSTREELRAIQNSIISSLPKPPSDHLILQLPGNVRDWYLRGFQPVPAPYSQGADIWLRYHTSDHVRNWARFVLRQLPECVSQVEEWG
jgi:hypothetical protein